MSGKKVGSEEPVWFLRAKNIDRNGKTMLHDYECHYWPDLTRMQEQILRNGHPGEAGEVWLVLSLEEGEDEILLWRQSI